MLLLFVANYVKKNCIYRPPGHPANFFEDFQDLLENVAINYSELYW